MPNRAALETQLVNEIHSLPIEVDYPVTSH